jgi:hypothetical protein
VGLRTGPLGFAIFDTDVSVEFRADVAPSGLRAVVAVGNAAAAVVAAKEIGIGSFSA